MLIIIIKTIIFIIIINIIIIIVIANILVIIIIFCYFLIIIIVKFLLLAHIGENECVGLKTAFTQLCASFSFRATSTVHALVFRNRWFMIHSVFVKFALAGKSFSIMLPTPFFNNVIMSRHNIAFFCLGGVMRNGKLKEGSLSAGNS